MTPAPTPIAGIPDLTNAAWQLFTVTPPGRILRGDRGALAKTRDSTARRVHRSAFGPAGAISGPLDTESGPRERYDWSDLQTVVWTVQESGFSKPGSFVSARITPNGTGSRIHVVWDRGRPEATRYRW